MTVASLQNLPEPAAPEFPWVSLHSRNGLDLAQRLGGLIRDNRLPAGGFLPAEREMASRLSLSRSTIRRALKSLESDGLLSCRQGSGYRITENASTARPVGLASKTIAIVSREKTVTPYVHQWQGVEAHVQLTLTDHLQQSGLHVLTVHPQTLLDSGVDDLIAMRPAAVVFTSQAFERFGGNFVPALHEAGIPVVTNSSSPHANQCRQVIHDHAEGARQLTQLMIERGRRHILPVFAGVADVSWKQRRLDGYRRAMSDAGLSPLEPLMLPGLDSNALASDSESASRLCMGFFFDRLGPQAVNPIDGVLAATDTVAQHVAYAGLRLGLTIDEIPSITGYDNSLGWVPLAPALEGWTPLATVDKLNHSIGLSIGQSLVDEVNQPGSMAKDSGSLVSHVPFRVVEHSDNFSAS